MWIPVGIVSADLSLIWGVPTARPSAAAEISVASVVYRVQIVSGSHKLVDLEACVQEQL